MRKRDQIENERAWHMEMRHSDYVVDLQLEVLLDIREQQQQIIAMLKEDRDRFLCECTHPLHGTDRCASCPCDGIAL